MGDPLPFEGAKLALFFGDALAVILRDDTPGLPFADHWDFPGGGREGDESPLACALRECHEELGLRVPQDAIVWQKSFAEGTQRKWFFVARMPDTAAADVVFGNEGQGWRMMSVAEYLAHDKAIPAFQDRLRAYLNGDSQEGDIESPPLL